MTRDQREIHRKKERSFENSKCSMLQPRLNRSMSFELPSTPPEEDRADRRHWVDPMLRPSRRTHVT